MCVCVYVDITCSVCKVLFVCTFSLLTTWYWRTIFVLFPGEDPHSLHSLIACGLRNLLWINTITDSLTEKKEHFHTNVLKK